jgi:hypothetical protein
MATLRKRGSKWQAQVRREGFPPVSKSFTSKEDAIRWGREQDRRADTGELGRIPAGSLATLLVRYEHEVTPHKRSATKERFHLRQIARHRITTPEWQLLCITTIGAGRFSLGSNAAEALKAPLPCLFAVAPIATRNVAARRMTRWAIFDRGSGQQHSRAHVGCTRKQVRLDLYRQKSLNRVGASSV